MKKLQTITKRKKNYKRKNKKEQRKDNYKRKKEKIVTKKKQLKKKLIFLYLNGSWPLHFLLQNLHRQVRGRRQYHIEVGNEQGSKRQTSKEQQVRSVGT